MNRRLSQSTLLVYRAMLVVVALSLVACGSGGESNDPPTVLIGIDGGEWQIIDAMIADGELPNLARIKREGAWGHLINNGMQVSPVVWTTFVTGHFARQHGILAHVFPYSEAGAKRPVTSELRQVPALWNIATHYGLRSIVLGYFVSHPPEEINGVMVSSRAASWAAGAITPEGALPLDEPRFQELRDHRYQQTLWDPYFGWDYDPAQADDPESPFQVAAATVLERHLEKRIVRDEFLRRAAQELVSEPSDLFIAYHQLPDYMSHSLWQFYVPDAYERRPSELELELFGEAVKQSYRFVDESVGDLIDAWQGEANILIVSDHGFGPASKAQMEVAGGRIKYLSGDHRSNGILMGLGPDIQPGEIKGLTIMEIAPTLAALMEIPVSGQLPGNVAVDLLRPGYFDDHPLQSVPDYSAVTVTQRQQGLNEEVQEEEMNNLRGLGYVGEGVDFDSGSSGDGYDFWQSSEALVSGNVMSEVVFFLLQGDVEAAQAVMALVHQNRPELLGRTLLLTRAKYRGLMERLPAGSIDPEPFERFIAARLPIAASAPAAEEAVE
jgi:hypothetical protein